MVLGSLGACLALWGIWAGMEKHLLKGMATVFCRYECQPAIPLYPNMQVDITGLASYDDIKNGDQMVYSWTHAFIHS
jgi:hypothetical protein